MIEIRFIGGSVAILAITALTAINVNVNLNSQKKDTVSMFTLSKPEALAGEYAGWDNFWQGQGFYMDEEDFTQPCPSEQSSDGNGNGSYGGISVGGGGSSSQTNPSGRHDIRCKYGDYNCTRVPC
jgi:hypothetical protein